MAAELYYVSDGDNDETNEIVTLETLGASEVKAALSEDAAAATLGIDKRAFAPIIDASGTYYAAFWAKAGAAYETELKFLNNTDSNELTKLPLELGTDYKKYELLFYVDGENFTAGALEKVFFNISLKQGSTYVKDFECRKWSPGQEIRWDIRADDGLRANWGHIGAHALGADGINVYRQSGGNASISGDSLTFSYTLPADQNLSGTYRLLFTDGTRYDKTADDDGDGTWEIKESGEGFSGTISVSCGNTETDFTATGTGAAQGKYFLDVPITAAGQKVEVVFKSDKPANTNEYIALSGVSLTKIEAGATAPADATQLEQSQQ